MPIPFDHVLSAYPTARQAVPRSCARLLYFQTASKGITMSIPIVAELFLAMTFPSVLVSRRFLTTSIYIPEAAGPTVRITFVPFVTTALAMERLGAVLFVIT